MESTTAYVQKFLLAVAAISVAGCALCVAQTADHSAAGTAAQAADAKEWPTFGHDSGGMRFSPLTQINPANVGSLTVAWIYHMKQPGDSNGGRGGGRGGPGGPGGAPGGAAGGGRGGRGGGAGAAAQGGVDQATAQALAEGAGPAPGRGGGGQSNFAISEVTPLVIKASCISAPPTGA